MESGNIKSRVRTPGLVRGIFIGGGGIAFFALLFYFTSSSIFMFLDKSFPGLSSFLRLNEQVLRVTWSLFLAAALFFSLLNGGNDKIYHKQFLKKNLNYGFVLIIGFVAAALLGTIFGNSDFWFIKYFLGVIVGLSSFLLTRNLKIRLAGIQTGFVAVLSVFFFEESAYWVILDPSGYPSFIDISSFGTSLLWGGSLLVVYFSALLFAKGLIISQLFPQTE